MTLRRPPGGGVYLFVLAEACAPTSRRSSVGETAAAWVAELAAARTRIMRTDELIDQIVYRLYGLTEEEIGIVEGNV